MVEIVNLLCPGCNQPQDIGATRCKYCKRPIVVKTLGTVHEMNVPMLNKYVASYKKQAEQYPENYDIELSMAVCFMKLKVFSNALPHLKKAMELNFDNGDTYLYYAISLLNGKRPFLQRRDVIDEVLTNIDAAISIEPKGIYYFFKAYILYDFFALKSLNTPLNYRECMQYAKRAGVSRMEATEMFEIIGSNMPMELFN